MFQTALIESSPALRSQNRWPALISFAAQAILAALLIAFPLAHPERILTAPVHMTLSAPPIPRPPQTPPPMPRVRVTPAMFTTTPYPPALPTTAPVIPTRGASDPSPDGPPAFTGLNIATGVPTDSPLPIGSGAGAARPAVAVASGSHSSSPLTISTGVSQGMLLAPIRPAYPHIALITRQQGTVEVQAVISKTGTVERAEAVSGPPLLRSAAVDAVRSARYHPFLLNGEPTEVNATFSIHFTLSQ